MTDTENILLHYRTTNAWILCLLVSVVCVFLPQHNTGCAPLFTILTVQLSHIYSKAKSYETNLTISRQVARIFYQSPKGSIHISSSYPGSGRGGNRSRRETQTSHSPAPPGGGIPRFSQTRLEGICIPSREFWVCPRVSRLPRWMCPKKIFQTKQPGDIMTACLSYLSWLLFMRRRSSSTQNRVPLS